MDDKLTEQVIAKDTNDYALKATNIAQNVTLRRQIRRQIEHNYHYLIDNTETSSHPTGQDIPEELDWRDYGL